MSETALVTVDQLNAIELFTGEAMDPLVGQIRAIVEKHVPDITTAKGRGELASLARKVASSKVILDNLGKDLVSDWKTKAKKVDTVRKSMRDELDSLRDYARQPLTDYEEAEHEKLRQEALAKAYAAGWDEAYVQNALFERERVVAEKEAEQARQDAEREGKAEAERLAIIRKERDERIAKEAAERATREAEEVADRKERVRVEEANTRQAAVERKASNKRHRAKIEREATEAITNLLADLQTQDTARDEAELLVSWIIDERIPHLTLNY